MSWSVSAFGKAPAVATKLAADFARIKCTEPEETIKNSVAAAFAAGLAAMPPGLVVTAEASGSQYAPDSSKKPAEFSNQLTVKLQPHGAFLE